jgi:plastocyanin
MYRTIIRLTIALAVLGLLAPAASAGGMATVHLDAPPENVVMGEPYRLGFMVMQHDVTPVNVEPVVVSATHRESGETYSADAQQEGATGHYVADLTFPKAGSWKWMITPGPFAGTSFESLMVLESAAIGADKSDNAAANHPAHIHDGSCQTLGDVLFPLSDVVPNGAVQDGTLDTTSGTVGMEAGAPVAISTTTVDVTIAELLASPHAINIHKSNDEIGTYVACGNISGRMWNGELIVGVQQLHHSSDVGIAVLREENEQTNVSLYMMVAESAEIAQGPEAIVEITGGEGGWVFSPASLEIAAGTTVTWTNMTDTAHTVMGEELAFEDSGPFGQGETYSQTFTEPGTYRYQCGPHPFMTGTIVVS